MLALHYNVTNATRLSIPAAAPSDSLCDQSCEIIELLMKLTTSKLVDFHKEPKPAHNGIKKWCEIANYHKTSAVATMCRWLLDSMVSTSGTFHIKSRNENKVNMQWNRPMYTQIGQNAKSYQRHQQPLSKPRDSSPMLPSRDYGNYYNKVHSRRCPTDE